MRLPQAWFVEATPHAGHRVADPVASGRPFSTSSTAYLSTRLRRQDDAKYCAAGLLAYRVTSSSVDVLLGRHVGRGKGPSRRGTWQWIGGKREPDDSSSVATAAREVQEESLGYITASWVETQLRQDPNVLWMPRGSYAIHLAEVEPGEGCAVADGLTALPAGVVLPLRRPPPPPSTGAATATLAAARAVLDEHDGGPMLLSYLMQLVYEREPRSRPEIKAAGGASAWCHREGILTARGPKGSVGKDTAWLGRADTLEVDHLIWLPWLLLATRANYDVPINLGPGFDVRLHPYMGFLLDSPGGKLLEKHFAGVQLRQS
jgi:hypothetical protein